MCLLAAVVSEQQQAFAVGIQPSGGINVGDGDEVFEAFVFFVRGELADNAVWFVEGYEHGAA